jgi:hypothetical protein
MNPGRRARVDKKWCRSGCHVAAWLIVLHCGLVVAQVHHGARAQRVQANSSLTFMRRDLSCVDGPIAKIDPKAVIVQSAQMGPVTIARQDLLQVSQGGSLVFSARSSWADVVAVHLRSRETLDVKLRNGKMINSIPLRVSGDGLVYKRFLWLKTRYGKDQIVTVDYLRMKPDSDAFDYFTQTAPALLFFYPEFYDRLKGLEGRIPVRLYNAVQPQNDAVLSCSTQ